MKFRSEALGGDALDYYKLHSTTRLIDLCVCNVAYPTEASGPIKKISEIVGKWGSSFSKGTMQSVQASKASLQLNQTKIRLEMICHRLDGQVEKTQSKLSFAKK